VFQTARAPAAKTTVHGANQPDRQDARQYHLRLRQQNISGFDSKTSFGSPIVIDNYIRQWTGGLGSYVVGIMDQMLKPKDAPPGPTWTAADTPLLKAFAARFPGANAQSIQDFYDTYADRKTAKASFDDLMKHNPAAAKVAAKEHPEAFATGDQFNKIINQLHKRVRNIYDDRTMSPENKRTAIDMTYLQMIETARRGNKFFETTARKGPARRPSATPAYCTGGSAQPID
jgi:hypothetical protein